MFNPIDYADKLITKAPGSLRVPIIVASIPVIIVWLFTMMLLAFIIFPSLMAIMFYEAIERPRYSKGIEMLIKYTEIIAVIAAQVFWIIKIIVPEVEKLMNH